MKLSTYINYNSYNKVEDVFAKWEERAYFYYIKSFVNYCKSKDSSFQMGRTDRQRFSVTHLLYVNEWKEHILPKLMEHPDFKVTKFLVFDDDSFNLYYEIKNGSKPACFYGYFSVNIIQK